MRAAQEGHCSADTRRRFARLNARSSEVHSSPIAAGASRG